MSLLSATSDKAVSSLETTGATSGPWSWLRSLTVKKTGWIGVDVGMETWKIAQVERDGERYRFTSRWCEAATPNEATSPDAHRARLSDVRRVLRGRCTAATLSAAVSAYRTVDLPFGPRADLQQMIREELATEQTTANSDPSCFDFWETPASSRPNTGLMPVSVWETPRATTLDLADQLTDAGFDIRVLDALPCALARATQLADPANAHLPSAIFDLGQTNTVFVIAQAGYPQFTRVLRGCGLDTFIAPLRDALTLSPAEAQQLLRRFGVSAQCDVSRGESTAHAIYQLLSAPLLKLFSEIKRTLNYVQQTLVAIAPERVWLCGGGSFLPQLPIALASELDLDVRPWTLSGDSDTTADSDESLFAVAAALSALAWESTSCS